MKNGPRIPGAILPGPGMIPTLRQRARDSTLRKFLLKLKIIDKDIDLTLYRAIIVDLGIVSM
jgi:hypothetical protein